ncbi:MAG: metal ABC transporter permease [Prochlorotrichaceae cyanobacterium]|jgi:zinc/manganese transport system permease protein
MTIEILSRGLDLFHYPFMQRALVSGTLIGLMSGLLGSFTVLRQLSFFSNALGHSALLGVAIGLWLGVDPSLVLLPFSVCFAVAVIYLLEHTQLWIDALLNILHSSLLAIAILLLSFLDVYKGGINTFLFGDILAVHPLDLGISAILLVICLAYIGLSLRTQMIITLHEPIALARGIAVSAHRKIFIILLALVVGVSIKAIGVLLVSSFIVIPACAARLLSPNFMTHVMASTGLGAISAIVGIVLSAFANLPSGPSIAVTQLALFLLAIGIGRFTHQSSLV